MEGLECKVPGWNSFPECAYVCDECAEEFVLKMPHHEGVVVACSRCGSLAVKLKYVSYPTDGPGFQEGYDPSGLVYGGGASGSDSGTDIAGLPLNSDACFVAGSCSQSCSGSCPQLCEG